MKLVTRTPKQSLNKAFLKFRPFRDDIDLFKQNLLRLLDKIDEIEREENQKNHIRDFLLDTYYKQTNEINTKGSQDLVIHLGKTNKDKVGVIIEAKRPSNKPEMMSVKNLNSKAFQELVLYYLRERIEEKNTDIKYCIATNIYEWFIIEASYFENIFNRNKAFIKEYEQWRDGKKVTKDTELFYNDIVRPFIDNENETVYCTYFDLRDYEKLLRNKNKTEDKSLIALYKIFSTYHLLKTPIVNDSNTLNEKFYKELLHIVGLEEKKKENKIIIDRKDIKDRDNGSLIENAIEALETNNSMLRIHDVGNYGSNEEERIFNIALELCITWINRILFLKLLEGQLIKYHQNDASYKFLNIGFIKDIDELFKLFHKVLAIPIQERADSLKDKYEQVPYLNSSLFEFSTLEEQTIKINSLDNEANLKLYSSSIIGNNKRKQKKINFLEYLFEFLDSFDFASEGIEDIQEETKTLINASVLGKVFEKINGYKDGSIFTPGFITMYMSRQSIKTAVIQKFKNDYKWNVENIDDIKNYLADHKNTKEILEYNKLINSLKICDPAVGSGHYLVSCLNEIIAIKAELGIFADEKGNRIVDYDISVENDELIILDFHRDIFEYNMVNGKPYSKESQRLQKTLFHEKQTIIENCLFGVDINQNSVKICMLRLWIELLKNAYYKEDKGYTELETLPNIDINIKCGNSLLNRFSLDVEMSRALKTTKYNIEEYRAFVNEYKNCKDTKTKRNLQNIIDSIKSDLQTKISEDSKEQKDLDKVSREYHNKYVTEKLFEHKLTQAQKKDKAELETKIEILKETIKEIKTNAIYKNAFEWRFEFPEILNNKGDFEGFDIVIGNPPYVKVQELNHLLIDYYKNHFAVAHRRIDISILFFELAETILKPEGYLTFISSNQFLVTEYGRLIRDFILKKFSIQSIIDYGDLPIFENTLTYVSVFNFRKSTPIDFNYKKVVAIEEAIQMDYNESIEISIKSLSDNHWVLSRQENQAIIDKLSSFPKLSTFAKCNYGIISGSDKVFILNNTQIEHLGIEQNCLLPLVRANNCRRFDYADYNLKIIYPYKLNEGETELIPEDELKASCPITYSYLLGNKKSLEMRKDSRKTFENSNQWYSLTRFGQLETFNKEKIIFPGEQKHSKFGLDNNKSGYSGARVFSITIDNEKLNIKFLLAVLNSTVIEFLIHSTFPLKQGGYYSMSSTFIDNLPIPFLSEKEQLNIIDLTNNILEAKKSGHDTKAMEQELDVNVFDLYNISKEDRIIIREAIKE